MIELPIWEFVLVLLITGVTSGLVTRLVMIRDIERANRPK